MINKYCHFDGQDDANIPAAYDTKENRMKFNPKSLSALLAAVLLAASLTACKGGDTPAETGTGTADTASSTTAAVTETETDAPRYDYMAADVSADVSINRTDYTDLTLTVPDTLKIEEEDVQAYIEKIRFDYRTAVNGTAMVKDQPLAMGDDAYIYYKGFLNGEEFEGGSNWDDAAPYTLGLGSGSFIPGFEEALVGIVPNTTSKQNPAEITVTFPEDYTEELAGKEVVFRIVVEYAVQYTMADYGRDFVENTLKYQPKKEFYAGDAALLDEFEEYVFDHLVTQMQSNLASAKSAALWEHLTSKAVCQNLPETEVAYYFGVYAAEVEYYYNSYLSYNGEAFKTLYPDVGSFALVYFNFAKDADWEAEVTKMAEQLVRRDMITHAIAEAEGLESVTEEEFNAQVQYWVAYYSSYYGTMTAEDVIQNMGEVFLAESALTDKLDAWLMEQVTFTYEDGTPLVSTTDNRA